MKCRHFLLTNNIAIKRKDNGPKRESLYKVSDVEEKINKERERVTTHGIMT